METVSIRDGGHPAKTIQIPDIQKVINAMQNSPTAAYLRDCSLHERIMLASLMKCVRKTGVDMVKWADV